MILEKYLFPLYLICLSVAVGLLVAATLSSKWMIIETQEEIDLGNVTEQFSDANISEKFDVTKKFTFGLKTFCVETYYEQLQTTEKECKDISIFKRDLEQKALEDALTFQILSTVLASIPFVLTFALMFCGEGPVKRVTIYLTIALFIFSATSAVSCCIMVKDTLTSDSSIVRTNIMAHIGHVDVDLIGIRKGSSYNTAVAGVFFLVFTIVTFTMKFLIKEARSDMKHDSDYNLLLNQ